MADSRDKPELETLNYKPDEEWMNAPLGKPASAPRETLGMNSHVIKPETRVNKAEDADKPVVEESCPLKKLLKDGQQPICGDKCTEQPNKNLMIITEIEGLMSQVNEKIHKLTFSHNTSDITKKQILWSQAIEEIDLFQKTTLFELRKAFE